LKNFSVIRRDEKVELSPAYDLVNTTIALPGVVEEIALPIGGEKRKLTKNLLSEYFGKDRLKLRIPVMEEILSEIESAIPLWVDTIRKSFLSGAMKEKYLDVLSNRRRVLEI